MTWKPDVMLYHSNCTDGFGAAWAAWMRWGNEVSYLPASYGTAPPDVTGKHVLIGDFSFKLPVLEEMLKTAASVVILDHHKTAQADLAPFAVDLCGDAQLSPDDVAGMLADAVELGRPPCFALFDMEKSGARLVWEFCHTAPVPRMIELIEDRDLWRWRFDDAKPFGLWLRSEPMAFQRWTEIAEQLDKDPREMMLEARAMQRFFDQKVRELVSMVRMIRIAGQDVPAANVPPMFASDVGNALLAVYPDAPFSACYSDQGKQRGFSLRSEDGRTDVSAIAKRYGGGGHRNAAGFEMPIV